MDATTALDHTGRIVTDPIANLTPQHREASTPCDDWNTHDLIARMCGGGHMVAGALRGEAPPESAPDHLADTGRTP